MMDALSGVISPLLACREPPIALRRRDLSFCKKNVPVRSPATINARQRNDGIIICNYVTVKDKKDG